MSIQNSTQLGQAIRRQRKHLSVTQKELAMSCGLGLRFIGELEAGKASCQMGKAFQVIQALGMNLELQGGQDA